MATEFRLPDLGEDTSEGEVVNVLVSEGDSVEENQPVIELETDKAVLEVPAPSAGTIEKVHTKKGDTLKVGDLIITIGGDGAAKGEKAPEGKEKKSAREEKKEPAGKKETKGKKEATGAEAKKKKDEESTEDEEELRAEQEEEAPAEAEREDRPERKAAQRSKAEQEPEEDEEEQREDVEAEDEEESQTEAREESAEAQEAEVVDVARARSVIAPPSVRRLARELGVSLSEVKGSAGGGRVTKEDVKAHAKGRMGDRKDKGKAGAPPSPSARAETAARTAAPKLPDFSRWGDIKREPLSNVRKRTIEAMNVAWSNIPHVTQFDDADITDLEALRHRHGRRAEARGGKLTVTVFVLKAAVAALREFPDINASIDVEAEELILKDYYHVGIAVDTDHGLVVPVIRDVDQKHLLDLSAEILTISDRARTRKVSVEELKGGTFTITNLGGLGGTAFTPIIRYPELAILGIARTQKRLVLDEDGEVEQRLLLPLCLSYDHRIVDGARAIRFLRRISSLLEDPALLLLEP